MPCQVKGLMEIQDFFYWGAVGAGGSGSIRVVLKISVYKGNSL